MKTPQAPGRAGKAKSPSLTRPLALKAFIGYADLPAFRGATAAIGEGLRTAGRKVELHPLLWRFEQLTSAHWRDRTLAAALEADIVVLTSSTPAGMTPAIDSWIAGFLHAAHGRRSTLVVISGPADAWTISIEQPLRRAKSAEMTMELASTEKLVA